VSHRISKHRLKHDEFAEDLLKTVNFVKRYSTEVLAVAVGLLVIAVGLVFISQNRAKSQEQAGLMLNSAHGAFLSGSPAQAQEGYKEIASRYGSTPAGQEAKIYLGNIYFQQRNYQEALKQYRECLKTRPKNPILLDAALSGIAACLEQQGDFAKAAEQYQAIADRLPKEEFLSPAALLQAGRCFAEAGLMERARGAYQRLIDDYPASALLPEAKTALQMTPTS
jgi:TolA-binding protein